MATSRKIRGQQNKELNSKSIESKRNSGSQPQRRGGKRREIRATKVSVDSVSTKSFNPSAVAPEPDLGYQRVVDYGTWAKAIHQFDKSLPKKSRGVMKELVEAFGLAANNICDLDSERTHLYNIMITDEDVAQKVPYFALDSEQLRFLAALAKMQQEAYEVVEFGDDREEKASLLPRPILG
jgi:hypothetical protein